MDYDEDHKQIDSSASGFQSLEKLSEIVSIREHIRQIFGTCELSRKFCVESEASATFLNHLEKFSQAKSYEQAERLYHKLNRARFLPEDEEEKEKEEKNHDKDGEDLLTSPVNFRFAEPLLQKRQISVLMWQYLLDCYHIITQKERIHSKQERIQNLMKQLRSECTLSVVRYLNQKETNDEALLFHFLVHQSLPEGFLIDLITTLYDPDEEKLTLLEKCIFPVFDKLFASISKCSSITQEKDFKPLFRAMANLCDIKVKDCRPICELLIRHPEWIPISKCLGECAGREMEEIPLISAFLRFSVFAEDDELIPETFFNQKRKMNNEEMRLITQTIQRQMLWIRMECRNIFSCFLINQSTKDATLKYFGQVLQKNERRAQMQVDEKLVATDGFMLNVLCLLQTLSKSIQPESIDCRYLFDRDCLVTVRKEDVRIKYDGNEVEQLIQKLNNEIKNSPTEWNFSTQRYFLTLHCQHISLIPCLRKYFKRNRMIREYTRMADEVQANEPFWRHRDEHGVDINRNFVLKLRLTCNKLVKAKLCAEAALIDLNLLQATFDFCIQHVRVLLNLLKKPHCQGNAFETNYSPSPLFSAQPDWYLEDLADYLQFCVQHTPKSLESDVSNDLIELIIYLLGNLNICSNPHVVAKFIDFLFSCSPVLHGEPQPFFERVAQHPLCQNYLVFSLIKFYSAIENTGSNSEFYDKFTIRYHINILFKSLWASQSYRETFVQSSRQPEFIRFINFLINDTIFLLDEILLCLRRIHDTQKMMEDKSLWESLSQDEKHSKRRQLSSDERHCRSFLILATEILDLIHYLTKEIREIFWKPEIVDRLAAMLNFFLKQFCGPKCGDLKVKNPEKYGWEPKRFLDIWTNLYLNLYTSEVFANAIVNDERSYSHELFQSVLTRMRRAQIKTPMKLHEWQMMAENIRLLHHNKLKIDLNDDLPEEFKDSLLDTLMEDPVVLPSGKIVNRSSIMRHLLNSSTDPFSRQLCTPEMLVTEDRLLKRITQWKKDQQVKMKDSKSAVDMQDKTRQ